jgi:hypothetical protein
LRLGVSNLYYERRICSQPARFSSKRTEGGTERKETFAPAHFASFATFCSKLLLSPFSLFNSVHLLRIGFARLCFVAIAIVLVIPLNLSASATELDPIKIAILVDGMASRGSGFDAVELHALGTDGLAAILNHLLPDTAPPAPPPAPGPPEEQVRRLIGRLDADEFTAREEATLELIAKARGRRDLLEEASRSDSLEVRLRAERVLSSWETRPAARLSAYLSGFWTYVEGLKDPERLALLARRTMKAFEQGMPEGDRLHLLRLCVAGVAHGRDDTSCDILLPLVRHSDVRIATLATETVGAYKTEPRFVPLLLVEALQSDRKAIVEVALRFVLGCQDQRRRDQVRAALRTVFEQREEPLRFQACLPLMRDFHDPDAWAYIIEQTASKDANRARTAFNWIGDTKNCGQPPDERLLEKLTPLLTGKGEPKRAAVDALGVFAGEDVVRRLIELLADSDPSVTQKATTGLQAQPDQQLVRRLLEAATAKESPALLRTRAKQLLAKLSQL